jgi:hypothetical protein
MKLMTSGKKRGPEISFTGPELACRISHQVDKHDVWN